MKLSLFNRKHSSTQQRTFDPSLTVKQRLDLTTFLFKGPQYLVALNQLYNKNNRCVFKVVVAHVPLTKQTASVARRRDLSPLVEK